jgi:hypothetical protein
MTHHRTHVETNPDGSFSFWCEAADCGHDPRKRYPTEQHVRDSAEMHEEYPG